MSEGQARGRVRLEITVYEPCPKHKHWAIRPVRGVPWLKIPMYVPLSTQFCGCPPIISAHRIDDVDLQTAQWMQLQITNLLAGGSQTVKDTSGNTHTVANNSAVSALTIVAGTGTTAAAVSDYELQTPVSGSSGYTTTITVGTPTETGTQGNVTLTGTITNSTAASINYGEIGVTITVGGNVFLITHDAPINSSSPYYYPVSPNGTMQVVYTVYNQ